MSIFKGAGVAIVTPMNEDGSVDFHQLNTLSVVEKDQVLAILTPSVAGEAGCDVIGRPIKPKKVIIKFLINIY